MQEEDVNIDIDETTEPVVVPDDTEPMEVDASKSLKEILLGEEDGNA